jgi:hypothetical protein
VEINDECHASRNRIAGGVQWILNQAWMPS